MSVDLDKGLDKAWEDRKVQEILAAPPSALAGLTEKPDAALYRPHTELSAPNRE